MRHITKVRPAIGSRFAAMLCSCLVLGPPHLKAEARPNGATPDTIELRDGLAIPPAGRVGRSPVHTDAIEAAIVAGRFAPPKAGDEVNSADGAVRAWKAIKAGDDGSFRDRALAGGYAYFSVESAADRVMILEASGHGLVYVNGEPRVGDPYSHGYVRVPVRLRAGANGLLFGGGRGSLRARLVRPKADRILDLADVTAPEPIVGREVRSWAGVVVVNATGEAATGLAVVATVGGKAVESPVPAIPPLGTFKAPVLIEAETPKSEGPVAVRLDLIHAGDRARVLASATLSLSAKREGATHVRTFRSGIDGSVQYFGLVPATPDPEGEDRRPGLILSLHGAGVEGAGQARVYAPKPGLHVVAPTNRRPYGFDWEDWGRLDAMEVLDLAQAELGTDPARTYLTGHSMGGHGTWHLGVTYPDRFAAMAPSAGWVSMASYGGARPSSAPSPIGEIFRRSASSGDTLALAPNFAKLGVYVLHGDADDNVPVAQARTMRQALAGFHPDFAYYEQQGAGHWWGNECCDWPPLIEFLRRHRIPAREAIRRVDFRTVSPGVSSRAHWAEIHSQLKAMTPSVVSLTFDPDGRRFSGTTENVARLSLDLAHVPAGSLDVRLDGTNLSGLPRPADGSRLWLARDGAGWKVSAAPSPDRKSPGRSGSFKEAFRNRMVFVYGTKGSAEENAWALAKARYDAETFYYRGNGAVEVVPDTAFNPAADRDRNVIVYGNADTHASWESLLGHSPVQVRRGAVKVGGRDLGGVDLACLFLRPRPGSDLASVGVVSGTGVAGMRLADRLPVFVSGVGFPDLTVLGPETLEKGLEGVRAAGFFGDDWGIETGEIR